jgi:hypothetical protein
MIFRSIVNEFIKSLKTNQFMKKFILIALLFSGMLGTTISIAQEGPKAEKKENKMVKKTNKSGKKNFHGSERKATKKTEKAQKKSDKQDMKEEIHK